MQNTYRINQLGVVGKSVENSANRCSVKEPVGKTIKVAMSNKNLVGIIQLPFFHFFSLI